MSREHFKPRLNQLIPGGRGTRSEEEQINQAESWERRSRDVEVFREDVPHAWSSISAGAATAVTAGTYVKPDITTVLKDAWLLDMPQNNRWRHRGQKKQKYLVQALTSFTSDTNATVVYLRWGQDGTTISESQVDQEILTAGDVEHCSTSAVVNLDHNQYVELWIDTDKNANITFTRAVVVVSPIGRTPILRAGRGGPS